MSPIDTPSSFMMSQLTPMLFRASGKQNMGSRPDPPQGLIKGVHDPRCDHSHTVAPNLYPGSVAGVGHFRLGRHVLPEHEPSYLGLTYLGTSTSHTCDRTHADVHHSHVLQPAVTALIGLTNRVASEAFLPTNHHALPTQPARSPKGPKPRQRGQAHAP